MSDLSLGPRGLLTSVCACVFALLTISANADEIGKWRRFVLSLPDSIYSGNPPNGRASRDLERL